LLFPLEEGRSFDFARRFFERHIQPKGTTPLLLSDQAKSGSTMSTLSIHSVIGLEEELASTCRAILDLCETNGYRFHEIGVVARTLDPYRSILQETFDRHCIPFLTTGGRPLIHEPLCKLLLQLASLPTNDFYRTPVLDIVSSPLYVSSVDHAQSVHYRPEQWKLIVSALHVTHGLDEWKRLEQASHAALSLEGEDDDTSMFGSLDVASEVIELCWQVVSPLLEECAALPQRGRIGQLLDAFRQVVVRHLRRPEVEEVDGEDPLLTRLRSTWTAIDRVWSTLQELDVIDEDLSWTEFAELLTHALERTAVPFTNSAQQGVMVLDAMAARGLPFKALFILGLNEKVFPRYIREDPFLRDRHRRVLDATLGFKIDEKLGGYDEETLLFTLLCQAATERLSLSFQRADDSGRMLAVSPYVAEGGRQFEMMASPVEAVPRRVTDRIAQRPTMRLFLPPSELAQWMAIHGQNPAPLLRAVGRDHELFSHGVEALERIEDDAPALSSFDGQTGPLPSHWSRVQQGGIAPTPLERYARCPFQYFAADVLRLEPVRLPTALEPDAVLLGTLCHAALRLCYESLLQAGWPAASPPGNVIRRHIEEAVARASESGEVQHRTGHYLLWELAKEQVQALVSAAVEADRIAQTEEPYLPIAFEVEAEGTVPLTIQGGSEPLKVHGRVDRIDRHRDSGALRIVDYKYKAGSAMKPEDRNLVQSAVRGTRLQPPLYACLDLPEQGRAQQVRLFFLAPHWTTPVDHKTYEATIWSSESGTLIHQTLDRLVTGIREGRFYIVPDSYCKTCDYRVACRREHSPTWWRSHRAPEIKGLRALRTVRVKDE
jgi:ATP-dependent helicase/nuclease subunit B